MVLISNQANKLDYSIRDQKGKFAFYVLLWKREGITLGLFDEYWKDVHGPVCARLPGQFQYWQFHVAHNEGGFCPQISGVNNSLTSEDNFDGIAELTFQSEDDRNIWFKAAGILMDDEHNIFKKAIGYTTAAGNSITYVDRIPDGTPNGETGIVKFHVMVKRNPNVTVDAFRQYMRSSFATNIIKSDSLLKFRLHLFDQIDNSRPDAAGVIHSETQGKEYDGAYEIAFENQLEREKFFASTEYNQAILEIDKYVQNISPFPERTAYTFVSESQMTLAGQRSSSVAELITKIGAINQIKPDITELMLHKKLSGANNQTNKTMKKRTNYYQGLAADYSRPGLVTAYVAQKLIEDAEKIIAMKEATLPTIDSTYSLAQIEQENKDWWPTHCEALRQGRGDILTDEYRDDLIYLCQDGPYFGLGEQKEREKHWWALIAQPGVTMCWPIVMFSGEHTYFEWKCVDDETNETLAKGNVTWVRRGHRGGCYLKTEQLTFYRDVFAPSELIQLITT
jgi:EthD domain